MIGYQSCATILPADNAEANEANKKRKIRALVAYWIIGLCNNYGYVVMLTAASDIIADHAGGNEGINVIIFTTEAIYYYIPNFYIVIALTLWEGLLGGSSYVNTFYRITSEVSEENKQFSMAITTFGDSIGIALAGAFAIFAHNKICDLPMP
ncbi:hypothetical protein NQ314_020751 [Rhamnusium bicolor]|uniref:Battenin n=1 Tax=Rhamnusium bicolor TaxID=1586634 RepID=A0AAV8WKC1_9CUCU|nr:hypothetical protein NQ314_020751 [Rhamnusium bicolor]